MDSRTVRELAKLCKLRLDEAQEARAEVQMGRILEYFRMLEAVDTEGAEPTPYPMDLASRSRPDVPGAVLSQDEVLANAPAKRAGPSPYGTRISPSDLPLSVLSSEMVPNSLNQPVSTGRRRQSRGNLNQQFPSPICMYL